MELNGVPASFGRVEGKARIVLKLTDIEKVENGEIIICKQTDPSFITALAKAGGIVTEIGGIVAHAAIIAREFGIPCVVQVKKATEIIKNGDFIFVDGDLGKITIY